MNKYYNTNGIFTTVPTNETLVYELLNYFSIKSDDYTGIIYIKFIALNHKVAIKLFGSIQNLYSFPLSLAHSYTGVEAEIKVSKQKFEKWVNSKILERTHKILFYFGFQHLFGSLKNLVQE